MIALKVFDNRQNTAVYRTFSFAIVESKNSVLAMITEKLSPDMDVG